MTFEGNFKKIFKTTAKQAEKFWNNPNLSQEFRETDKKSVAKRIVKEFVKNHIPQIPWNLN